MIKSQRWFVVALLFLAGVINYLDRAARVVNFRSTVLTL